MRIDHYREPCWGAEPGFCLRVIESSDPDVDFADEIAGFDHHWGNVYEVVVLVTDVDETSDGTWREYDLIEVVSEEPVADDSRFTIELGPEFIERVGQRSFELVSDKPVLCETDEVCQLVADAVVEGLPFEVELTHAPTRNGAFIAHTVQML